MPGRLLQHSDAIVGSDFCNSSGSEHDQGMAASSMLLAEMVNDFIEEDYCSDPSAPDGNVGDKPRNLVEEIRAFFHNQRSRRNSSDDLRQLVSAVDRSRDLAQGIENPQHRLRSIAATLRSMGFNAAVCKSRWSQAKGISKGEYAYIDVLLDATNRVIIDTDFKAQFVIARPSDDYRSILAEIPDAFVGTGDQLQTFLHLISPAMKRSLKAQSLTLPPWRRPDYLVAKWFSPYRRTTNPAPSPSRSPSRQSSDCESLISSNSSAFSSKINWPKPTKAAKTDHRSPGLGKLLAEAGMISQVTRLPVTVV